MDVTNENFISLLPEISETIRECDFVAIDTELSGLMRERSLNRFDLPDERFAKAFELSRGYFIMQFGLSCFTRCQNQLEYSNRTYNFYIFPQPHEGYGDVNRTFSLQAHAIQFLSENNFDFNKLFKHGISYLTFEEKQVLSAKLKSEIKARYKTDKSMSEVDRRVLEEKNRHTLAVAKGFLEVLEQVILNKKPIVGHNLVIDLIQIINQFIEPLTDDYSTFKETCHSLFPIIYDTKFIAHSIFESDNITNNQSRLNDLFHQLRGGDYPKIVVKHLNEFHDENQMPHQAGYDAYMSGYCFISLCDIHLSDRKKSKAKKEEPDSNPTSIAQDYRILTDFANKIHLSYSHDFKNFDLGGDEGIPDRSHVFYMEFPSTWELEDIFQVFQQNGGVYVGRLSRTSALCALREPKQLDGVMKKISKLKSIGSVYKIFPYDLYLEKFKNSSKNEAS